MKSQLYTIIYDLNLETAKFLALGLCDFGETLFSARNFYPRYLKPCFEPLKSREKSRLRASKTLNFGFPIDVL